MEDEFSNELEHELSEDSNVKRLEDFFSKNISTDLTPQEMMVISISLSHVVSILKVYNKFTNVAVFDVKAFIKEHPEYKDVDFNNLDEEQTMLVKKLLTSKNSDNNEEFNKGDILIKSIMNTATNIGMKLIDSYDREYSKQAPVDTIQFFTMLENCLASSLGLVKAFFAQERY